MSYNQWQCSICGASAFYDGRCGDGPVLMCGCDRGAWVDDGRGGYYSNPRDARPVQGEGRRDPREYDQYEYGNSRKQPITAKDVDKIVTKAVNKAIRSINKAANQQKTKRNKKNVRQRKTRR